jgi:hypothetical protein
MASSSDSSREEGWDSLRGTTTLLEVVFQDLHQDYPEVPDDRLEAALRVALDGLMPTLERRQLDEEARVVALQAGRTVREMMRGGELTAE